MIRHYLAVAFASALLLAPSAAWSATHDEPLPRRGFFGVGLGVVEDGDGVLVTSVLDASTAADMGVMEGDVIREIEGAVMAAPSDVQTAFGQHRGGDAVAVELDRGDARLHLEAVLRSLPFENMAAASMTYASVTTTQGVRLRTIASAPDARDGPVPAVMLIQGGGCGSIDTPIGPLVAQAALMHALGSQGFATLRVEKSGVGDSEGPPCSEIGYFEELDGYRAGLAALRADPAVDPERVFLVGVSLGGVFAPILANETPVAGIITYGTISFAPKGYPGRSDGFFEEFQENVDVLGEWARVEIPVLVLHGEFDENTQAEWSTSIVAAVNDAHPGLAEHRELPGLDHCWTRHASMEESAGHCGQGEDAMAEVVELMLAFLREHS